MTQRPKNCHAKNVQAEITDVGEQTLIDGVRPVSLGEKLTARTSHPMVSKWNPNAQQKPCDLGLFDEVGRAQVDLIDFITELETSKCQK